MRVLFMPIPGIGHAFPMVPLAWALRSAGHEVAFATAGDALAVQHAGLPVFDVLPGLSLEDLFRKAIAEHPEMMERMRTAKIRSFGDLGQGASVGGMFGAVLGEVVGEFVHTATSWRPDLVVTSPMLVAGFIAGAALDVPVVAHGFGVGAVAQIVDVIREHARERLAEYGVAFPGRVSTLDVVPPSLLGSVSGHRMRYVPYNGGGIAPEWLAEEPSRPRIGVTLGTVAPKLTGLGEVEQVLAAAPEVDAEFVLALGHTDLSALGELPPNVRAVGWVPLNALLRSCAGVIHHGGAGTMLTAAADGVPQLIMPNGADRYINADAAATAGAALTVEDAELTPGLVRRLLDDADLRVAAERLRADIEAQPTPAEVAADLTALVTAAH